MSLPNIQFFYRDGSPFALVHEANAAIALWREKQWPVSVNGGQKFEAGDWRGRCALEDALGVTIPLRGII